MDATLTVTSAQCGVALAEKEKGTGAMGLFRPYEHNNHPYKSSAGVVSCDGLITEEHTHWLPWFEEVPQPIGTSGLSACHTKAP